MFKSLCYSALAFSLIGCQVSSRVAMKGPGGRNAYNITIQETTNEQMLLNLVRMRYNDIPFFLNVSSVTSQYSLKGGLSAKAKIPGYSEKNPGDIGADASWTNTPTIQYSPLGGRDFARQLMQPIDIKVIQELVFTGWDVSRIFRLAVQILDDVPNAVRASGPSPAEIPNYEKFYEVTQLMRDLQLENKLRMGVDGDTLQINFNSDSDKALKLAQLLPHTEKHRNRYVLNLKLGYNEDAEIGLLPRSLLGCMYYVSLGVHLPQADLHSGKAYIHRTDDNEMFNWDHLLENLMNIKCADSYPDDAYVAVHYRKRWFYITDHDLQSKKTFALLQQLYNLQAREDKSAAPILTIPIGR
ncbi:MAG: hypothetical protein SP1CHLAM54_07120 [Chlamydiia bacterium]|nr:hypothetical protein [Chlamydiia bacterium]MCH9615618.1 hypothetical protein [Chlamydiia bacterium]MCH9628979.1 hypothetical protein [Chlamydiia bacterium]